MNNIVLVQAVDNYGPNKFLPLAVAYQWLVAAQHPLVKNQWNLRDIIIEKINISDWVSKLDYQLDAVAMSCYVWNWEFNNELAKQIKQRYPHCRVIIGGPQIPKSDAAFVRENPWFDLAVIGENENVLQRALMVADVCELTDHSGVITKDTQSVIPSVRNEALADLPSPILTGFYDKIIDEYEKKHAQTFSWQVTFETMRGCPYHCAFCDIGDAYWNKVKLFDLDRIRKEIKWMSDRRIEYVSVCDSNWGLFERDYEITQWVIDAKLESGYPKFWDVTWAKNNLHQVRRIVMLDQAAGTRLFKGVTFAVQSMDPTTLDAISRFNVRNSDTYEAMRFYQKNNVATYSELIWPLPGETLASYKQGLQKLLDLGQRDFLMVHPLVLTYNAPMGQPDFRKQHSLVTQQLPLDTFWLEISDRDSYIVEHVDVVRSTNKISFHEMLQGHLIAHWLVVLYFYGWAHAVIEYVKKIHGVRQLDFISDWIKYFQCRDDLIGHEHRATLQSLTDVFERETFWGRQVSQSDDIYWEYKSATSVIIHRDRDSFAQCLAMFLKEIYGIHYPELIEINMHMCVDWQVEYPYHKTFSTDVLQKLFDIDSRTVEIDHWDDECQDDAYFIKKAYHWQRKNRYWRCSITPWDDDKK